MKLVDVAHARSGDKGDRADIGLFARDAAGYELIKRCVTAEKVASHFAGIAAGGCPGGTSHSMAERLARMAGPARVPPGTIPGVPRVRGSGSRVVRIP